MKKSILIPLKVIGSILLCLVPFYYLKDEIDWLGLQEKLSQGLLNPEIEVDPYEFTYLLTILPPLSEVESEPIEIVAPFIPQFESRSKETKRIYLYNTHQTETYTDGVSIYEVTIHFAQMLKEEGFEVVFESNPFLEVAEKEGLKYNQLYTVSRRYINDAFVNYGGFDLVIDVHRDSCERQVSTLEVKDKTYAKLMFVVGMKSKNAAQIMSLSHHYTDIFQQVLPNIMREPFERQSVYNQDMHENMLLLEVGGDQNSSTEALNSLQIVASNLGGE